ncbi:hypothetical protein [Thiocystis violascens]|uniref:Uncharacterized protein n=1 Tax=Thiocystis violascens (strain ATCC 17096 / DSM 198 / 6111) TaxID=765911 RepID=I3YBM9_THIV6|nr:hypothetical protein [Thiocystis violascens]AFL74397.1 hypothetical protein Thivi_2456 [Thiocystis violascens DSM 198]
MVWAFLIPMAGLWLVAPVVLLISLIVTHRRLKEVRQRLAAAQRLTPTGAAGRGASGDHHRYAPDDLDNLLLLRQELDRLADAGELTRERHRHLMGELDRVLVRHLRAGGATPDSRDWHHRRALAWSLLTQSMETPPGPPPWQPAEPAPTPAPSWTPVAAIPQAAEARTGWPALTLEPMDLEPLTLDLSDLEPPGARLAAPAPPVPPEPRQPPTHDSPPAKPKSIASTTRSLSGVEGKRQRFFGWPKLILPFLAQNIGWFIGAFCFVSGALFLIANTSGFVNALTVFASLTGATAFLLWAGYQFRRKVSEMVVASSMLLTLAMLLAPLDLAVAVRLIDASDGNGTLLIVSLLMTALTLTGFAWAAALSSALMDRVLRGTYPWLLTALAAVQLAAPLAGAWPDWPALAALHLVLLALLAYGLWRFARAWLQRLFVDQRLTTYYAAGMLVYTATVSFVHLTWIWPEPLPAGYAGPFLMALSGLLFPVDAAFKDWVNKYAFLSRVSFALYALSTVAIAVSLQSTPTLLLTLTLGAILYTWVTWRYRTLPPLLLLLGSVAGLYGFGILTRLPPAWHALASLPGLVALLLLARWIAPRSPAIARHALLACGGLLIGPTVWSLFWSLPGWVGFVTALTAAMLLSRIVRRVLALPDADPRWADADAGVVILASAAVSYAPVWTPLSWEAQTAFGLLALAALWSGLGLHVRWPVPVSRTVWIRGALASVALGLLLGGVAFWPNPLGRMEPLVLLTMASAVLLWLSLGLRRQMLFYGVLILVAGLGGLIKLGYFPGPSTGSSEFLMVLALWSWLTWLDWRDRQRQALRSLMDDVDVAPDSPSLSALVRVPLERAMALLWALGLVHLSLRLLDGALGAWLPAQMGLAILSGALLIGHFHLYRWAAMPFLLGLAGLMVQCDRLDLTLPWLGAVAVLYVLLVWRIAVAILASPAAWRLAGILSFTVPGGAGGRRQAEASLHACALIVATVPVAASLGLALLRSPAPEWLPALVLSLLLFVLTGWPRRSAPHALAALATLTVGVWLIAAWLNPVMLFGLGQPLVNVLLSAVMALAALGLEPGRHAQRTAPLAYWRSPLSRVGGLLYALALAGALLAALAEDPGLPSLLALLCLALFPVFRPLRNAANWRGPMLALLLGGLILSVVSRTGWNLQEMAWGAIVWGYLLWLGGNLWLPRWNARWPDWAVTPALWPLLGLAGVLGGATLGFLAGQLSPAAALALLTPYIWLLLRNTAWSGMAWLAVAALTGSGMLATGILAWQPLNMMLALLWLNLLFLLGTLWRRHGPRLAHWLNGRCAALDAPLFWIPFALLALLTLALTLETFGWRLTVAPPVFSGLSLTGVTVLLALTAGHAFRLRPYRFQAHLLLLGLTLLAVAALLNLAMTPNQFALAMTLWNGLLLLAWRYGPPGTDAWRVALTHWLNLLPAAAITLLFAASSLDWRFLTLTLIALAGVTLTTGWWMRARIWLALGLTLALTATYTAWFKGTDPFVLEIVGGLAPWYAVQTLLLWLGSLAVQRSLDARAYRLADDRSEVDPERLARLADLEQTLSELRPWLLVSGLGWLLWHGWSVLASQAGWGASPWHFGVRADPLAAGAALLLLAGWAAVRAWRRPDEPRWIDLAALLLGLLAGYARLVGLGLAPFAVGDTTVLMAAAYVALLLHQFSGARPFYRLALLLPILAVATTPLQLASGWSGGTLLAASVLYLTLASRQRHPWALYLGVLALNGAVYLWAPLWAERYELWQFYIAPAAVSVLALLHLHRAELRPSVLTGARLTALSALYAGAALDLFLRPELSVFVLALALAFLGILLGIALRIRAFLYAGVVFLIFNVIGQLVQFYPDQGIGRALILIGLGATITGGMVIFNLKREVILRRVRILRADLAAWE